MSDKFIPLSVPNLKGNELKYITNAVETEWVSTAGTYVSQFENDIAKYVGTENAVACQSGTAGIHISLILCGVTHNDMVIVPALTFIAAVNPVKYIGAHPVFMDCDDSLCLDANKLERFCSTQCEIKNNTLYHKQTGKKIPALIVVHVFGNMANMKKIKEIAKCYHLKVIEDATEALGTKYIDDTFDNAYAGTIGDIGVYSFNGNKIITTGGGGMIVSHDNELLQRAKHLTTQAKSDEKNFYHDDIGYNYRLTNLQAAMGKAQLEQLESFIAIKEKNYKLYIELLKEKTDKITMLSFREGTRPNYWFYALYCTEGQNIRDSLMAYLEKHKIQTRPIWGLVCDQLPYINEQKYMIDRANIYWKHVINIPCSSNLTAEDVKRVSNVIKSHLKN